MAKTIDKKFKSMDKPGRDQYIPIYGIVKAMQADANREPSIMPEGEITLPGLYQATCYAVASAVVLNYLFPK